MWPVTIERVDHATTTKLLDDWGHELGPCHRPFGRDEWVMFAAGRPVSLAVTASTVSATVTDETGRRWGRQEIVELARICSDPGARWATRPMLRLWREVLAHEWTHWPAQLLVSYSTPGKAGHIYRHDGWTRVRDVKPSTGGGTWSNRPKTADMGDGVKALWIYRPEATP